MAHKNCCNSSWSSLEKGFKDVSCVGVFCSMQFDAFYIATFAFVFDFCQYVLRWSLVVPFLRFGEVITGGAHFPLTSDALKKVLTGKASHEVLLSIAHAVGGQDFYSLLSLIWIEISFSYFISPNPYSVSKQCFMEVEHHKNDPMANFCSYWDGLLQLRLFWLHYTYCFCRASSSCSTSLALSLQAQRKSTICTQK